MFVEGKSYNSIFSFRHSYLQHFSRRFKKIITYALVSTWSLFSFGWEHVKRIMHPCARELNAMRCMQFLLLSADHRKSQGWRQRGSICLNLGKLIYMPICHIWYKLMSETLHERTECVHCMQFCPKSSWTCIDHRKSQGGWRQRGVEAVSTWDTPTFPRTAHTHSLYLKYSTAVDYMGTRNSSSRLIALYTPDILCKKTL